MEYMFVDKAKIYIKAGNGGNGAISFRRENMYLLEVPMGEMGEMEETLSLLSIPASIH